MRLTGLVETILEELPYTKIMVPKENLTKKMKELWGDEALTTLATQADITLSHTQRNDVDRLPKIGHHQPRHLRLQEVSSKAKSSRV